MGIVLFCTDKTIDCESCCLRIFGNMLQHNRANNAQTSLLTKLTPRASIHSATSPPSSRHSPSPAGRRNPRTRGQNPNRARLRFCLPALCRRRTLGLDGCSRSSALSGGRLLVLGASSLCRCCRCRSRVGSGGRGKTVFLCVSCCWIGRGGRCLGYVFRVVGRGGLVGLAGLAGRTRQWSWWNADSMYPGPEWV